MNYKTLKIFDCQDMPKEVKQHFFEIYRYSGVGNYCYVDYNVADSIWGEDEGYSYKLVDEWLIENGAEKTESVIIKHWQ